MNNIKYFGKYLFRFKILFWIQGAPWGHARTLDNIAASNLCIANKGRELLIQLETQDVSLSKPHPDFLAHNFSNIKVL